MSTKSVLFRLEELQKAQHLHDVAAHQDIMHLIVPKRLRHFTLHFAKYQGAISKALRTSDRRALTRALTDSLIIILASANALNIKLWERVATSESDHARSNSLVRD